MELSIIEFYILMETFQYSEILKKMSEESWFSD